MFRPILIKILEGFFTQSPFPDLNKRVEIATACNQVLQIEKRGERRASAGVIPRRVVVALSGAAALLTLRSGGDGVDEQLLFLVLSAHIRSAPSAAIDVVVHFFRTNTIAARTLSHSQHRTLA